MDLKLISKDKEKLTFLIKDTNPAYVNTLRRLIIGEVPTLAIDEVKFKQNTSALYDEMLAHRLGLIPLKTDLKSYSLNPEGKTGPQYEVTLTMKVKGPKIVYASDLISTDKKVQPVYPGLIIAKLAEGQEIELEAKAVLGKGKWHAKFSPGLAFYNAYPNIDIINPMKCSDPAKICPTNVFRVENKKLKVHDLEKCNLCMACVEAFPNDVKVEGSKKDFIFKIESWGQLKPKEMVEEALKIFNSKLDEFEKGLKSVK